MLKLVFGWVGLTQEDSSLPKWRVLKFFGSFSKVQSTNFISLELGIYSFLFQISWDPHQYSLGSGLVSTGDKYSGFGVGGGSIFISVILPLTLFLSPHHHSTTVQTCEGSLLLPSASFLYFLSASSSNLTSSCPSNMPLIELQVVVSSVGVQDANLTTMTELHWEGVKVILVV